MATFGQRLRQQREERGISLGQIAEKTNIRSIYLVALENDDFEILPGTVFAKGFVKAYAEVLGVEPQPLVDAYLEAQGRESAEAQRQVIDDLALAVERNERDASTPSDGPGQPDRMRLVLLIAVPILLVVAGAVAFFARTDAPSPSGPTAVDATNTVATTPEPTAPARSNAGTPRQTPPPAASTEAPRASAPSRAATPPADPAPTTTIEVEPTREAPRPEPTPVDARPEPRPMTEATTPPATASGLSISEHGVGTGVENRQLVGRTDRFRSGSRVWFWTRVVGGTGNDRIRHVWLHEGSPIHSLELKVGGSPWRTYSYKTIPAGRTGSWTVEARDADGTVLASDTFQVD
jgi:cytoskeletal protein RodZ